MSLRLRVLLLAVVPVLLFGTVATWGVAATLRRGLLDRAEEAARLVLAERGARLEELFERRLAEIGTLAASPEARAGDREGVLRRLAAAEELLGDAVEALSWTEPDGRTHRTDGTTFSVADRAYWPRVAAGETVITGVLVSRATESRIALVLVPAYDAAGRRTGTVAGSVHVERLLEEVAAPAGGLAGEALLLDGLGELVACASVGHATAPEELVARVRTAGDDVDGLLAAGDALLCLSPPVEPPGWRLAAVLERDALLGEVRAVWRLGLVFVGLCVSAAGAVAWLLARSLTAPVGELVQALQQFGLDAGADAAPRPARRGPPELAALRSAFRGMAERVEREAHGRRAAERALEHSQRMEALGMLAGGIAHDFNNLLTVVSGCAATLREESVGTERDEALAGLTDTVGRGAALTRRLLGFARREPLEASVVDLCEELTGLVGALRRLVPASVELAFEAGEEPCPVEVDRGQLEQVVFNLVVNARDALGGVGRVEVRAGRGGPEARALAAARGLACEELAFVCVHDGGAGMDAKTRERALEPFFTTKARGAGTGLGLSVCDGIVREHGGALALESAPGEGTTAWVLLPLAATPIPEEPPPPLPAREVAPVEVLLCEDDARVRPLLARQLEALGHRVRSFGRGAEALAWLGEDPARRPGLVVSDVQMPGLPGADLAEALEELRPGTPVLFVSGHPAADARLAGRPVLAKPFRRAELAAAVERALATARTNSRTDA